MTDLGAESHPDTAGTDGGSDRGLGASGVGLATVTLADATVLDTWYPHPALGIEPTARKLAEEADLSGSGPGSAELEPAAAAAVLAVDLAHLHDVDPGRGVRVVPVVTLIDDLADPPLDAHDAYLRLHLLSHRLIRPNDASMDGIFGVLSNVAWTSVGPCPVDDFEDFRLRLRATGRVVEVFGVDKFPRMTDYVVPSGVRIANADRVRLGAHLGIGTTVMHEGFVNFNAGTLGTAMVEGRISQGVVVGEGSDIGAGSSLMGTLSGGGKEVVSVGQRCLLGANGGIGISLGDDCAVEAGLYVTAGTVVRLPDGQTMKAGALSGRSDLLFRRNSLSGTVEVLFRSRDWGTLNEDLHQNG